MWVGKGNHITKRPTNMVFHKVDCLIGQEVGGIRLGIRTIEPIRGFTLGSSGLNAWPFGGVLQDFPVATVEHIAVVFKSELSIRRPTWFGRAVEVPLSRVTGDVPAAAQDLGESHHIVSHRDVVLNGTRVLRITSGNK
jgi:hypothetical protein